MYCIMFVIFMFGQMKLRESHNETFMRYEQQKLDKYFAEHKNDDKDKKDKKPENEFDIDDYSQY